MSKSYQHHKILRKAHNLTEKPRTKDVIIEDNISFRDLLLSEKTLHGLTACGFSKPSPIQRKAIPLGKCGFDLIMQAKSGTGKTCVFTVIALEMVDLSLDKLQVLILTPTREIAVQIRDVIKSCGKNIPRLKVEAFIGGLPLEVDKRKILQCQIAVGAPGRVKHLISSGVMRVDAVRLFVLDEADKLVEDNFRQAINFIYLKLPEEKQMIAASATFPPQLESFVTRFMNNPVKVSPGTETFLIGIRQYISILPAHLSVVIQMRNKLNELFRILSTIPFEQCLIFSNYQSRAESICNELNKEGWPAVYISGSQNQLTRLRAMSALKEFRCRVLLSTDLTARGIDAEYINLVVNLDLPYDGATYMHRIGRAGRFGAYGMAITIVQEGAELDQFRKMLHAIGCNDSQISVLGQKKIEIGVWDSRDEDVRPSSILETESQFFQVKNDEDSNEDSTEEKEKPVLPNKNLTKLFACHLTCSEAPKINEYDNLLEFSSQIVEQMCETYSPMKKCFLYKDYPSEIKSLIINVEKNDWKEHKKRVKKLNKSSAGESVSKLEPVESVDKKFVKYKKSPRRDRPKSFVKDLNADFDSVEQNKNQEEDKSNLEENDENSSVVKQEGSKKPPLGDTFCTQHWRSMYHSQLATIRNYANYLKQIQYWNTIYDLK